MKRKKRRRLVFILAFVAMMAAFFWLAGSARAPEGKVSPVAKNADDFTAESATPVKAPTTTFAFAGDMMFDRYVNHSFKNIGLTHIFDNLDKTLFSDSDIRFANLEGPISPAPIVDDYPTRALVFNMPPETISTLQSLNLNGVSLANNHTLNAGVSGLNSTRQSLSDANIKYAGSQTGFDESNIVEYDTTIPVTIVCVDYLAFTENAKINAAIKSEKDKGKFVIVFPHWGTEYSLTHTSSQETAANAWIDAGADLIIGSHPHVVEDVDVYKSKPIIYSLGNFVFDQTFSADTQQGLIVTGTITVDKLELKFTPVQSKKLYPQLATDAVKNSMLTRILSSPNLTPYLQNGETFETSR